jgi:hypothetical protein
MAGSIVRSPAFLNDPVGYLLISKSLSKTTNRLEGEQKYGGKEGHPAHPAILVVCSGFAHRGDPPPYPSCTNLPRCGKVVSTKVGCGRFHGKLSRVVPALDSKRGLDEGADSQ